MRQKVDLVEIEYKTLKKDSGMYYTLRFNPPELNWFDKLIGRKPDCQIGEFTYGALDNSWQLFLDSRGQEVDYDVKKILEGMRRIMTHNHNLTHYAFGLIALPPKSLYAYLGKVELNHVYGNSAYSFTDVWGIRSYDEFPEARFADFS